MALSDTHWAKIMEAIPSKIPRTRNVLDPNKMMLVFKENWELFSDESTLDEYLKTIRLEELAKTRSEQAASIKELDAEIKKLENER